MTMRSQTPDDIENVTFSEKPQNPVYRIRIPFLAKNLGERFQIGSSQLPTLWSCLNFTVTP